MNNISFSSSKTNGGLLGTPRTVGELGLYKIIPLSTLFLSLATVSLLLNNKAGLWLFIVSFSWYLCHSIWETFKFEYNKKYVIGDKFQIYYGNLKLYSIEWDKLELISIKHDKNGEFVSVKHKSKELKLHVEDPLHMWHLMSQIKHK